MGWASDYSEKQRQRQIGKYCRCLKRGSCPCDTVVQRVRPLASADARTIALRRIEVSSKHRGSIRLPIPFLFPRPTVPATDVSVWSTLRRHGPPLSAPVPSKPTNSDITPPSQFRRFSDSQNQKPSIRPGGSRSRWCLRPMAQSETQTH